MGTGAEGYNGTTNGDGTTTKEETISVTNYELIVPYERQKTSADVWVRYVEQDSDPRNVIYEENKGRLLGGDYLDYAIPGSYFGTDSNTGLWCPVETMGPYQKMIELNTKEIVIYFTRATANLTVKYVEQYNESHVFEQFDVTPQIGTNL